MPAAALLIEHLNLNIPHSEVELARRYYLEALGGAVNPRSTNERQLHVNVGASQFHLVHLLSVQGCEPCEVPQVWRGAISLWTAETLEDVRARVESLRLTETAGGADASRAWAAPTLFAPAGGTPRLLCTCPWGNCYDITCAPTGFALAGQHAGEANTPIF